MFIFSAVSGQYFSKGPLVHYIILLKLYYFITYVKRRGRSSSRFCSLDVFLNLMQNERLFINRISGNFFPWSQEFDGMSWMICPKLFLDDKEDSLYTLFTQHWCEICVIVFTRQKELCAIFAHSIIVQLYIIFFIERIILGIFLE